MKMGTGLGFRFVRRDPSGVAMDRAAEAGRIARAKASAPPGLPFGPARGAMHVVTDWEALPGGTRRLAGRHLEEADVFTRMCRAARLRHERATGEAEGAVLPFTWGQISTGRDYRTIAERYSAGGVKCVQIEGSRGGGGDFMDAHLAIGQRLDRYRRAIGAGSAMAVRRIRPSARGAKAGITDRAVVDAVCLHGKGLAEVLEAHGWSNDGKHRAALLVALVGALDRMQGYRD